MRYLTFPGLQIDTASGLICNPLMGYDIPATAELAGLLERARSAQTAGALGLDAQTLATLRQRYLLIAEDELDIVGTGLQRKVDRPLGRPTAIAELEPADATATRGVAFIGAPIDAGGGLGARKGPDLIRRAFPTSFYPLPAERLLDFESRREIDLSAFTACDLGDVPWAPNDGLETFGRRLRHVVERVLAARMRPLLMGGDHSITPFALAACYEFFPELHIVHFDAHTDLALTPGSNPSLTHANPMLFAIRDPRLMSLLQLGVRMIEPKTGARHVDPRVTFRSARELARCDPVAVFSHLPAGAPCYVSFDVDVISPLEAPNTGTPEIGGLTYYQAMELLDALARRVDIVGADFVEVAATPGGLTGTNTTALIAARLMMQLALGFADQRPIADYVPIPS